MNYLVGSCPFIDSHIFQRKEIIFCGKFLPKVPNILHVCLFVCFPEYPSPPFLKTIFTKCSLQELIGNQQRFFMRTFRLEEETCSPWEKMTSSCTESTFETDTCKYKLDSPAKSTVLIGHKSNFRKEIQFCYFAVINLLSTISIYYSLLLSIYSIVLYRKKVI